MTSASVSDGLGDTTVTDDLPGVDSFPHEQIGRYRLIDKLAQGNFGLVFSARDLELDRDVALKVLNPDHVNKRDIVRRFLQEASATARVVHPGVVTILDCGQYDGGAYIAMDLLDGESLAARLESCVRLLPHDAVEIARQIASALEAAHAAGVLHRDLKPDNIFIVNDASMPDGLRVKILDFGLAKVTADSDRRNRTRVHSVFGTPRYMSPEQCRSSTAIDHRADIYALGCILFELLTGAPPFDGEIDAVIAAHLYAPIPLSGCSRHLDELIAQLMAKDPARRLRSMTEVRCALDRLPLGRLGSTPAVAPPHRTPLPAHAKPPPIPARRRSWPLVAPGTARLPNIIQGQLITPVPLAPAKPRILEGEWTTVAVSDSGPRAAPLPPYFPRPPTIAVSPYGPTPSAGTPHPQAPPPTRMTNVVYVPSMAAAAAHAKLPASPVVVPIGLPAPPPSDVDLSPPRESRVPLIVLAIACALSGILAALVLA